MNRCAVYVLVDPITDYVRYVGKSINPKERLATHIREARKGSVLHSRRWISGLLSKNKKPELIVLEECDSAEDANESEKHWIASFRIMGANLTNRTDGGDGQSQGYKPSQETIAKMVVKLTGQKRSVESRARLKAAFNRPEVRERRRAAYRKLVETNPAWLKATRGGRSGMKLSEETKKKQSASWTEKRKLEHAERQKAKPFTDAWKKQLSLALKARWDKYRREKNGKV